MKEEPTKLSGYLERILFTLNDERRQPVTWEITSLNKLRWIDWMERIFFLLGKKTNIIFFRFSFLFFVCCCRCCFFIIGTKTTLYDKKRAFKLLNVINRKQFFRKKYKRIWYVNLSLSPWHFTRYSFYIKIGNKPLWMFFAVSYFANYLIYNGRDFIMHSRVESIFFSFNIACLKVNDQKVFQFTEMFQPSCWNNWV